MGTDERATTSASWSRRGALRYGGAAAFAAAGMRAGSAVVTAQGAEATPTIPDDFKVVLHAAEIQDWPYVLSNLKNLTREWPRAHLRVVVDGSAVTALQGENNLTAELGMLAAAGVELQVCPNALHEHRIDPDTVPAFASTALGGVVALVLAHREGYVYVKP